MWGKPWFQKAIIIWALAIASVAILLVITSLSGLITENSSLIASWVQAIGSIIAIVVGAKAIQWQVKEGVRRAEHESLVRVDMIIGALFNCRRSVTCFVKWAGDFQDASRNAREAIWWMNLLCSMPLSELPCLGVLHSLGFISAELDDFKSEVTSFVLNPSKDFKFHAAFELINSLEQAEIAVENYLKSKGTTAPEMAFELDGVMYYPAGRAGYGLSRSGKIEGTLTRHMKKPHQ
ncbi:hypothetical protein [Paracidovorax oryzae]|uniref:hypothetical protein n=1 Tax=Paracidovorax oryzae TaxID=862720 RepID=UPI0012FED8B3|nr:hypothetical protein [Paracidovorax oryzae]